MEKDGRSSDGRLNIPDRVYRKMRSRPLLMIHLIDIDTGGVVAPLTEPVVAWGISFPATRREEKRVEYVVNTTWIRENFSDDIDEDEMLGDDV